MAEGMGPAHRFVPGLLFQPSAWEKQTYRGGAETRRKTKINRRGRKGRRGIKQRGARFYFGKYFESCGFNGSSTLYLEIEIRLCFAYSVG
jgi:hypothetical protein